MTIPTLSYRQTASRGDLLAVDLDRLMVSRMLVQANSGGGKSWAVRQLLEETFGRVQHIVIDPEGEFHTLREKFPYVLAAKSGGEALASPGTAKLLCRRIMESGASAILDLYELAPPDRREFVRIFLTEMTNLPRSLWRPCLVVIDEAHTFMPEKGQAEATSTEAGINFIALSRKRGFCPVLATQRLSKLNKDAAAELNNKMIGRTGLDVDMDRAAKELGFDKVKRQTLSRLGAGEFYVYGPAISPEVTTIKTGAVATTHPEPGKVSAAPAPTPAKVRALLAQFADLPKEAAEEARSIDDLRRVNADLTRKLRQAEKGGAVKPEGWVSHATMVSQIAASTAAAKRESAADIKNLRKVLESVMQFIIKVNTANFDAAGVDRAELEKAIQAAIARASEVVDRKLEARARQLLALKKDAETIVAAIRAILSIDTVHVTVDVAKNEPFTVKQSAERPAAPRKEPRPPSAGARDSSLPKGERIVLTAIAQDPTGVDREQVTVLTGYKRSSRDSYLQRLQSAGHITIEDGTIHATDTGLEALGDFEPLPTGADLLEYWLAKLPAGESKVLKVITDAHPSLVSREHISSETGYLRSSRDSYLQRLTARKLVSAAGAGLVRASANLFD